MIFSNVYLFLNLFLYAKYIKLQMTINLTFSTWVIHITYTLLDHNSTQSIWEAHVWKFEWWQNLDEIILNYLELTWINLFYLTFYKDFFWRGCGGVGFPSIKKRHSWKVKYFQLIPKEKVIGRGGKMSTPKSHVELILFFKRRGFPIILMNMMFKINLLSWVINITQLLIKIM
jgi:hypothetical protein